MTTIRWRWCALALVVAAAARTGAAEEPAWITGPGILCDLDGGVGDAWGQVGVRASPTWEAKTIDLQPCGARVRILAQSRTATMPPRTTGRYEGDSAFEAHWFKVQVAASHKTGWVFAGDLFRWEVGGTSLEAAAEPEGSTPVYGFGRSLFAPSEASNEEPAYTDHHLPFLATKGEPRVVVFSAPDEKPFPVLTLSDDTGVHDVASVRLRRKGKSYLVTLDVVSNFQEGGKRTTYVGTWTRGDRKVELEERSSKDL